MNRRSFLGRSALTAGVFMSTGFELFAQDSKNAAASPIVETSNGKVRGFVQKAGSTPVYSFKGIPYGGSTAPPRRFMPPAKPLPWTGVRESVEFGPRAPQTRGAAGGLVPEFDVMEWKGPMSEDCLHLNIWTPGLKDGRKRPVMVWIHGGGFANGSANFSVYDGRGLAGKHDVVFVGVNHRLNIFGYLYPVDIGGEKYMHSGNVGMQDLILALQWVRDNIEAFGGDPGRVTIFGQSGGGSKTSTLMGMPAAKGLFHRAIAMSGSEVTGVPHGDATESAESVLRRPVRLSWPTPLAKMPSLLAEPEYATVIGMAYYGHRARTARGAQDTRWSSRLKGFFVKMGT